MAAKISKLMIWPSRKINLGNYETVEVSAGVEITFDSPVDGNSKEVLEALDGTRKFIGLEFRKQLNAFGKKKEAKK